MFKFLLILEIFLGNVVVGEEVFVYGWVCICCDLKVGLLFLVVYDGFCFDLI